MLSGLLINENTIRFSTLKQQIQYPGIREKTNKICVVLG